MKFKQILLCLSLMAGTIACQKEDLQPKTLETNPTVPKADFNYTVDNAEKLYPVNVTFQNLSVNGDSYLWNFGEDTAKVTMAMNTSTEMNPTHQYKTPGDYVVTLTV